MNPQFDLVMSLLNVPFSRRSETEKRQILELGRPKPVMTVVNKDRKHSRSFQNSWYSIHNWLCGSSFKESFFCWPCLLVGTVKNNWSLGEGFKDLKNFSRGVKSHEGSKEHLKNCVGLKRIERNTTSVADALQEHASVNKILHNENVRKNRLLIAYLIDVTIVLGKQELAFRGHDEKDTSVNQGNFREFFQCLIKRNAELVEHASKFCNIFSGQSKTIQNELIFCVSEYLKEFIHNEIINAQFFAVIADDTTDVTEKSQCTLTIRYVDKTAEVQERFLGFFDVSADRSAEALFEILTTAINPFDCKTKLIAQSYDGAAVMAGELNGLQAKVKSMCPLALFTHCCAHRLNLVLQQGINCISKCRIFFATLSGIPSFFHHSPKRTFILNNIIGKRVPAAAETRWCTRSKIVNLVADEWTNFIHVFEEIVNNPTSGTDSIRMAQGYLKNFSDFEFSLLTFIYRDIFGITDLLFQILQSKSLNIPYCQDRISDALNRVGLLRSEEKFQIYFDKAKSLTDLPSKRGRSSVESEIFNEYKILFYEILDSIKLQLTCRFQDLHKLKFLSLVDSSRFAEYGKKFPQHLLKDLSNTYPNIFDLSRLENELSVVYNDTQFSNLEPLKSLKIIDLDFKDIFKEVHKLFSLILTIPATSVTAERNFSCLKRIKTYLRNSMNQERLSALATISIEKELLTELSKDPKFYDDIIDKFANLKERRIDLIYKK